MNLFLLIMGIMTLVAAFLAIMRPYLPAAPVAYAGVWFLKWAGVIHPSTSLLISWGIIVATVIIIDLLLPQGVVKATNGMAYMAVGGLVGLFVGLVAFSPAWVVAGAAAGLFLGALAFSRLPSGRELRFHSSRFFQYICAKGLPAVVALGLIGIVILLAIMEHYPEIALKRM